MTSWAPDTITAIAGSDDLHVAPFRADGSTYGTLTWIWSVVVDGELYVRAYNGTASRWYGSAMNQRAGRIEAAGGSYEVIFESADPSVHDAVDAAYQAKYTGSAYLPSMVAPHTRAATVRIVPRA
jgi:hypothetical protein